MAYKTLQLRRDTAANWTTNDPTLAEGEIGVETDTLKFKIGDGSTAWTALGYAATAAGDIAELVMDTMGTAWQDTNSIDITYTDGSDQIEADVLISESPGDVGVCSSAYSSGNTPPVRKSTQKTALHTPSNWDTDMV